MKSHNQVRLYLVEFKSVTIPAHSFEEARKLAKKIVVADDIRVLKLEYGKQKAKTCMVKDTRKR